MKKIMAALCLAMVSASCVREKISVGFESTFSFSCEQTPEMKSSLDLSAFQLHDASVFVYDGDGLVTEAYSSSGGNITVIFPDGDKKYDVFVLANAGNVKAPSNESELETLILDLTDVEDMSDNGIPMSGSLSAYLPTASKTVKVSMLCSRVQLSFNHSAQKADYSIKSVRLRNCAGTVCPFGEISDEVQTIASGDSLTHEEIVQLQGGGQVSLYALENKQGVLLPFNDDPFQKIPANLPSLETASRCTYLEVVADVTTPAALFSDVCFRTYLGSDITSDFNMIRSRNYKYNIDFESNMIREEDWRIEPQTPVVMGELKLSKTEAKVIKGINDTVFVTATSANDSELEFETAIEGGDTCLSCQVKEMYRGGEKVKALIFSTDCPIDGLNDYGMEPDAREYSVTLRSKESYGGLPMVSAGVDVKVFHEVFPIFLKTVPSGSNCRMYAYSNNPMGIPFSGSILVRQGQNLTGTTVYFDSAVPGRGGAFLGEIPCREDGMAIFLKMKPTVSGRETDMYMGEMSKEYFGPGGDHSPGNMADYTSDDTYNLEYSLVTDALSRDYIARLISSSGYVFRLDNMTTGWNCQDSYSLDKFEGKPFYFINGGLQIYVVGKIEDSAKYLDDSGRIGFKVFAFEPGRDLCLDSQYGTSGHCTFGAQLGVMTQFWGNVHRWLAWREYEYGVYLSINGCSCWAGATQGSSGYVMN